MATTLVFLFTSCLFVKASGTDNLISDEAIAVEFLHNYNEQVIKAFYTGSLAEWKYQTNLTEENKQEMVQADLVYAEFEQAAFRNASRFNVSAFSSEIQRQFRLLMYIGDAALEDKSKLKRLQDVKAELQRLYATTMVCGKPGDEDQSKCYSFDPDIAELFATSRDYSELAWAWVGWHNASGLPLKELYSEFVELNTLAIEANGHTDMLSLWQWIYEVDDLEEQVLEMYDTLKPLYLNLHAYVRRKLIGVYGEDYVNPKGAIPAHLLGNMWAQQWHNVYYLAEPYPGRQPIDITPTLKAEGYTPLQMFQIAEEFFRFLGLLPASEEFWQNSLLVKPDDGREVVCHASAWDFIVGNDVRMKMCTVATMEDFIVIHHEMGHIQYFLQYRDQPFVYKDGANPAFHEAVGDVMALSVSTPEHLYKLGLVDSFENDPENDINFLMKMALQKIAFLPFGLMVDLWRWKVFSGEITPENYNTMWWQLRMQYQGIVPPVERLDEFFDPGAKHHIPANTPYIRYFLSFVIQFQFHKALCIEAGQLDDGKPLHRCDIHKSLKAGKKLADMLKLGKSKPWMDAMEVLTGQRIMDATPLVEYFRPLIDWLEVENEKNGDTLGWDPTWRPPPPQRYTSTGSQIVTSYSLILSVTSWMYFIVQ
ncbi:angiotensin-converting enzyme-like [Saccoglossus kowalevskii]